MVVKSNPEFGVELALVVPYAYYLHTQGKLKTVITSKGMKPFYYFCDDVREEFDYRTIDNAAAGLNDLPNNWIHHNSMANFGKDYNELTDDEKIKSNGWLNYSQWICPPYVEYYKNKEFKLEKPTIFITNKYNLEHGEYPLGFFDIQCLYEIFTYLTEKGYAVVYKRATNKEGLAIDQNEQNSIFSDLEGIKANVDGIGIIDDHQLTNFFEDVYLLDNFIENNNYNEIQLKIMANTDGFISVCGGNSILSSCFGKTVISYVHKGRELIPGYFDKNSYFRKLSNANIVPVFDVINDVDVAKKYGYNINNTGKNDYSELLKIIKENFK